MTRKKLWFGAVVTSFILVFSGCTLIDTTDEPVEAESVPGGDPERGRMAVLEHGCASCHTIPDVESVSRTIGPDLTDFHQQLYIAGQLPNRPEELIRWIQNPQEIVPGSAMPNMGITEEDARDIAAFLYDQ